MSSYGNARAIAGPSRLTTVFGVWRKKVDSTTASPEMSEVTLRVETPSPKISLPARPPATYSTYHEPHNNPNVLDDFFGADAQRPSSRATISRPPPYAPYGHEVVEVQPGVYSVTEPPTLARMLFIYGFLFFPFWIAGIYILFSPLLPTPDWESGKTEAEKTQLLRFLRDTEKKWARRCLYAMLTLVVTVSLLAVIIKFGILPNI